MNVWGFMFRETQRVRRSRFIKVLAGSMFKNQNVKKEAFDYSIMFCG